jgi:hypothetical protein
MSERSELPAELTDFLLRTIDSVAELEALLLAHGNPGAHWDAPALAARLYVADRAAQDVLASLHRRGLLHQTGDRFAYQPASDALRQSVDQLAVWYPRALVAVTRLIHSKPGAAVRGFADAFRLRDDK